MARKKAPRFYHEPWVATKSKQHGERPFKDGIPDGYPEGVAGTILENWERSDKNADWILWGSKMAEPAICKGPTFGTTQIMDDKRIIAVRRSLSLPDGSPTHEEIIKRIAECVNALAGVADPATFIADIRALLLGYVSGECVEDPRNDNRVLCLLARCIPPEELEKCHAKEDFD